MNKQQTGNDVWRRALNVRAAWDEYYSILSTIAECGRAPSLTQSLTRARYNVERAQRSLFDLVDQKVAFAGD